MDINDIIDLLNSISGLLINIYLLIIACRKKDSRNL
jgi:hypothetical protein